MKRVRGEADEEVFEAAFDALEKAVTEQPKELLVIAVVVDPSGEYAFFMNKFSVTKPDVYQMVGLLEQAKLDVLASVPRNRPLREPAEEAEDDEIDEPIGQA